MISEGEQAPAFALPAVVDGAVTRVDVAERFGQDIVVMAFYPADFGPACTDDGSCLREFEVFSMQSDVQVVAISPDSVYSHRAFADRYDLTIPLLADTRRNVAEAYGLTDTDDLGQSLCRRAVVVVGLQGTVEHVWVADDPTTLPDAGTVQRAVADVGGDATALGRYRVAESHYREGRRTFTSALRRYETDDWTLARGDFETALAEFETAADAFGSAARFAASDDLERVADEAREKAATLQRTAEWLADSAAAFSNGKDELGEEYRTDAEQSLSTALELSDPPSPAAITIDDGGTATVRVDDGIDPLADLGFHATRNHQQWRADGEDEPDTSEGDAVVEAAVAAAEEELERGDDPVSTDSAANRTTEVDDDGEPGDDAVDDDLELGGDEDREIRGDEDREIGGDAADDDREIRGEDELDEEDIELDLTDPTETDDGNDEDDFERETVD